MDSGLYAAYTGNLANSGTSGFRARRLQFEDMIYQNMITPGSAQSQQTVSAGLQIVPGPTLRRHRNDPDPGRFQPNQLTRSTSRFRAPDTSRSPGPTGPSPNTRSGNFHLNNQGQIVTADGDTLLPAITIPSNASTPTISQYGVVSATLAGQTAPTQLGVIQIATFANPGGLSPIGGNSFPTHRFLWQPSYRYARRRQRRRNPPAGLSRRLQCQRRRRVRADNPCAACIREQLQGRPRCRRHVLPDQQHDPLKTMNPNSSKSVSLACLTALWGLVATPQSLATCANAQTATALHSDHVLQKQWLTSIDCNHPERPPPRAKLTSTPLPPKQTFTQSDKPLTIRTGDRIRLTYHQSATRMELTGIAEESGATGSTIHVRLTQFTSSTSIPKLKAIVSGPSQAEIQP